MLKKIIAIFFLLYTLNAFADNNGIIPESLYPENYNIAPFFEGSANVVNDFNANLTMQMNNINQTFNNFVNNFHNQTNEVINNIQNTLELIINYPKNISKPLN